METRQAGTVHALEALKSTGTGERLGDQWGAAGWEQPSTADDQSCVVRGRLAGMQNLTLPLFPVFRKLIRPSATFEVKKWGFYEFCSKLKFHVIQSICVLTDRGGPACF